MTQSENREMFEIGSEALRRALGELRQVFINAGFRPHRLHANESTIRVYLPKLKRPLLNPRLLTTLDCDEVSIASPCLTIDVWIDKSTDASLRVNAFPSTKACRFISRSGWGLGEDYAGFFVIPFKVSAEGSFTPSDAARVGVALSKIRECLN